MKYLKLGILSGILFFTACGTQTTLENPQIENPTPDSVNNSENNNEKITPTENQTVEINPNFEKKYNEKTENYVISLTSEIKNTGQENLMEVSYQVDFKDENGNVIKTVSPKWCGEDVPLYPNSTTRHYYGFQDKFDGKEPITTEVKEIKIKTDKEIPPIHLPQPREYWYKAINNNYVNNIKENHPTKIKVIIDHMGAQDIFETEDAEKINDLVDAFAKIKIAQETQTWVTDNYNWICFTFSDGTEINLSLNLYNYEMFSYGTTHLYELESLNEFLKLTRVENN